MIFNIFHKLQRKHLLYLNKPGTRGQSSHGFQENYLYKEMDRTRADYKLPFLTKIKNSNVTVVSVATHLSEMT